MDKKKLFLLFFSLIIVFTISGCSFKPLYSGYVTLYGTIRDYNDYSTLSNVLVTVNGYNTYTNYNGNYQINVWTDGKINWAAETDGYWPETKETYVYSDNHQLNASLKNKVDFSGTISGKVTISGSASSQNNNSQQITSTSKPFNINPVITELNTDSTLPEYIDGEILVRFKPGITAQNLSSTGQLMGKISSQSKNKLYKIKAPDETSTNDLYDYYQNLDSVETVSYNLIGQLMVVPDDYHFGYQWHYDNTYMSVAWDYTTGSSGVTVAVIDTGYVSHPDLNYNLDTNYDYDFVDNDNDATDTDSYCDDFDSGDYLRSHGTHVAGIIGAVGNNGTGVAGVNWDVNILPIRIFQIDSLSGSQYFETYDLYDAIYYAVDSGASVINLSLAYASTSIDSVPIIEEALAYAYNNKVTVVAAAGNSSTNYVYYPARSYYTIAVGASNINDQVAYYSNYGSELDIFAPGGDIRYDYNNDSFGDGILSTHGFYAENDPNYTDEDFYYFFMEGTSMAAPQVSGVAALLYSAGITNPGQIKEIIGRSSRSINDSQAGNVGLLDAEAALRSALTAADDLMEDIQILATIQLGDTYYVMSDISGADYQGNYQINHVKTNDYLSIIGWINTNDPGHNVIDAGDIFGKYGSTVFLSNGEYRSGIDFNLSYISTTSTLSNNNMKVVFGPPPISNQGGE